MPILVIQFFYDSEQPFLDVFCYPYGKIDYKGFWIPSKRFMKNQEIDAPSKFLFLRLSIIESVE